jgi:XRE family transcriptional regulator, fatty acid utilization regulator
MRALEGIVAEQKIFAGPRLRRLRQEKGLTQTAMAGSLGVSPSYLNLIERNQRPLTVQLLLKLAAAHELDIAALQSGDAGVVARLREAFAEPLLAGELASEREIIDLAEGTPNAAAAFIKLHRAWRDTQNRLSELADMLAQSGQAAPVIRTRLPADEARDVLEQRPWHFASLEEEAHAFLNVLKPGDDLPGALKGWLKAEHGLTVRVLPADVMPNWRRRYERHTQRLFISERLAPHDQLREIAMEACNFRMQVALGAEINALRLSSDESRRVVRFELMRYAAHALIMPRDAFSDAARRARHDVDVLRARFRTSWEQAAMRLVSIGAHDAKSAHGQVNPHAIPFFALEIDHAGNAIRRVGAQGWPQARFGGRCPKLPIHAAFAEPGRVLTEIVAMPDGAEFALVARTLEGPQMAFRERPRRTALMLGFDAAFAGETVYGRATGEADGKPVPIGPSCRLCERQGCMARAEPPLTKPLGLDDWVSGFSIFDYA